MRLQKARELLRVTASSLDFPSLHAPLHPQGPGTAPLTRSQTLSGSYHLPHSDLSPEDVAATFRGHSRRQHSTPTAPGMLFSPTPFLLQSW